MSEQKIRTLAKSHPPSCHFYDSGNAVTELSGIVLASSNLVHQHSSQRSPVCGEGSRRSNIILFNGHCLPSNPVRDDDPRGDSFRTPKFRTSILEFNVLRSVRFQAYFVQFTTISRTGRYHHSCIPSCFDLWSFSSNCGVTKTGMVACQILTPE